MWEQAIFVRKDIFDEIGGFTMTDRVDDFEFCRQMAKFGSLALLHPPVIAREDCHPDRDMLTRLKYRVRGSSAFQSRNWLT